VGSVLCWILGCVFKGVFGTISGGLWRDDGVVRFDKLCVCLLLFGLGFSNVSGFVGGDDVGSVSK